ncbi:hypothetical protein ACWEKT_22065 [Nocardia takedensis]|uniref:hypothetical protein n=1 Tax=Nocardia takedensis TaxID=259390 RepID=UPI00030E4D46|nr:hypothetical protein [Nocardia takedensis]
MFIKKMAATAFMAIAATGVATATAHGEATLGDVNLAATDGPVAYTTTLAADHSSAQVSLASGRFVLTPDSVTVLADDGAVVGAIPTTLRTDSGTFGVTPSLDASATELTLTPVGGPTPAALQSRDIPGVHEAGGPVTTAVGAGIGCLVGVAIGIWFFVIGAIPGCLIGAAIGAAIGFFFVPGP